MQGLDPRTDAAGGTGGLDKVSEILLDAIGFEPASVDALVERTGLPSQSVASKLLILELEGAVEPRLVDCTFAGRAAAAEGHYRQAPHHRTSDG
jgi:DprA winged helix domain